MSSAEGAELTGLFIAVKAMVTNRQNIIEMGWPQSQTTIQTDKSTTVGVTNNTIVQIQINSMNMRLWWIL